MLKLKRSRIAAQQSLVALQTEGIQLSRAFIQEYQNAKQGAEKDQAEALVEKWGKIGNDWLQRCQMEFQLTFPTHREWNGFAQSEPTAFARTGFSLQANNLAQLFEQKVRQLGAAITALQSYEPGLAESILLENPQRQLLAQLVRAFDIPGPKQAILIVPPTMTEPLSTLKHPGLTEHGIEAYDGDIAILEAAGLVMLRGDKAQLLDITPKGRQYLRDFYQTSPDFSGNPEPQYLQIINSGWFDSKFPNARRGWKKAAESLAAASDSELSTIGHFAREALSDFCSELSAQFPDVSVTQDRDKTALRLKTILKAKASSGTNADLIDGLINYFGTLSDAVQRLEHRAHKEATNVTRGDARRVVYLCLSVFAEVSLILFQEPRRTS